MDPTPLSTIKSKEHIFFVKEIIHLTVMTLIESVKCASKTAAYKLLTLRNNSKLLPKENLVMLLSPAKDIKSLLKIYQCSAAADCIEER